MCESSLSIVGAYVIEPTRLARVPGAEQSAVGKFYTWHGDGVYPTLHFA